MTTSAEAYQAFVHEMSAIPDHLGMLGKLIEGHGPDGRGWCTHESHMPWEQWPCTVAALVAAVLDADVASLRDGG